MPGELFKSSYDPQRAVSYELASKTWKAFMQKAKDIKDGKVKRRAWNVDKSYEHYMRMSLCVFSLYFTGRRVSELCGQPPYTTNPGLKPMDINWDAGSVKFYILKKNPIRRRTKAGTIRKEEELIKKRMQKESYIRHKIVPNFYLKVMKFWIEKLKIEFDERIFNFDRRCVYQRMYEIAREKNLYLNRYKHIKEVDGSGKPILDEQGNYKMKTVKALIHPHAFRHGFSKSFLNANKNDPRALGVLKDYLEHSSLDVTMTYLQTDNQETKELLGKWEATRC